MSTIINTNKQYTLIDNFDKIDLDTYQKHGVSISSYQELSVPLMRSEVIYGRTVVTPNFQQIFRYSWFIRPDLLRFLTNRRFYLSSTGGWLAYPVRWPYFWSENNGDYTNVESGKIGYVPLEKNDFLINIIDDFAGKLNNNFALTDSTIRFSHYFTSDGLLDKKLHVNAADYVVPARFGDSNYVAPMLLIEKYFQTIKTLPNAVIENQRLALNMTNTWGNYGPHDATYFPGSGFSSGQAMPSELPANALNKLKVMQHSGRAPWKPPQPSVANTILNLINRLITFAYYHHPAGLPTLGSNSYGETIIAGLPEGGWTRVIHYYFVGVFQEGTVSHFGMEKDDAYINTRNDIFDIEPFYNFYSPGITEEVPGAVLSQETQLPNIYTYYSYKNNKDKQVYYGRLVKLDHYVDPINALKFNLDNNKFKPVNYYKLINALSAGGFDTLKVKTGSSTGGALKEVVGQEISPFESSPWNSYRNVPDRYKKIVFGENLEILKDVKALKEKFPYGVQINLPTIHDSPLMKHFKSAGALNLFTTLLGNYFFNDQPKEVDNPRSAHKFILQSPQRPGIALSDLQIFNLTGFFSSVALGNGDSGFKLCDDSDCVKFGQGPEQMNSDGPDFADIYASKFQMVQQQFLDAYVNERLLSFWKMYGGSMCHTEILLFEIAKFKIDETTGTRTLIQSIFIPNIKEANEPLTYIDTQVFPAQRYVYEIFTHTLIIGNQYQFIRDHSTADSGEIYSQIANGNTNNPLLLSLRPMDSRNREDVYPPPYGAVENNPYAVIIRAPYHNNKSLGPQTLTVVTSKPPLPPDIVFHPYENMDNKILILLNQNYGMKSMLPIPIFGHDEENIALQFEAQKYEKKLPSHLLYHSDDGRGNWEVYRMTRPPTNYGDFTEAIPTIIDSTVRTGYEDAILKNVDYYYMARFRDAHGNISNPTTIFYLRMVKEESFPPYLIIKEHNIAQTARPVFTVPFKKFIKIKLKDSLRKITGTSGTDADIGYQFGGETELKRYKFRITSKKTGKQIDINVRLAKSVKELHAPIEETFVADPQTEGLKEKIDDANKVNMTPGQETPSMVGDAGQCAEPTGPALAPGQQQMVTPDAMGSEGA